MQRNRYGLLIIPGATLLAITVGGALLWNLQISFTRWAGYDNPVWAGLKNYRFMFMNDDFRDAVTNAIIFVIPFSILPTIFGALIATFLYDYIAPRFGQRTGAFFRITLYLPAVVPVSILGLIWLAILDKEGVLNQLLAALGKSHLTSDWLTVPNQAMLWISIIIFWLQLGYTTTIFIAGLARIDSSLYEAADLDGANAWHKFRHITLTQLRPEIFVVLLVTAIGALKIFAPIYWITGGGPIGATMTPSVFSFNAIFGGDRVPFGAAVSSLFALIVGLATYAIIRLHRRFNEDEN